MECVPALRLLVLHAAVRVLPLPLRATAAQAAIEFAPSLKSTLPVGFVPVTVAVKVTLAPSAAGLAELASVVVVGCCATAYAVRRFELSVAYTAPLTTIKLSQWNPPERARLHNTFPDTGSSARMVLPLMENTVLFATMGGVPTWMVCVAPRADGCP